uniref:LAGLIDADG endonuclease n=1 Tax=Fomes fomentarius TaxID=40442 RepID=UPI0030029C87
ALCFGKTHKWVKLSNSGDALKIIVPSHNGNVMSGQNNYLGTVTSYDMTEKEMGYRGSKSANVVVKEQRVDGSCFGISPKLRYTLMGGESRYQIKIPSKQLNIKNYSSLTSSLPIKPWFITGLIDAEGSFSVIVDKNKSRKLGWRVKTKFQLGMHLRDILLITKVKDFFGGIGSIHISQTFFKVNYSVDSIQDLTKLIVHFENYPLHTQKAADFILFKEVITLMKNKYHLSNEGLNQIINIKASMNLGLSEFLKSEFLSSRKTHY